MNIPSTGRHRAGNANRGRPGFALVVTISLLVLLTTLALGLLSLSAIAVRQSRADSAQIEARANARLALLQALDALQKYAGDDRRITADAAFVDGAPNPHAVGVWESWSPNYTTNPTQRPPDYDGEKKQRFRRWLVSSTDPTEAESLDWIKQAGSADMKVLFNEDSDGFALGGQLLKINTGQGLPGEYAWAVSQEATKAKLSVAGDTGNAPDRNDQLHAQPRPTLALSEHFGTPTDDEWNRRALVLLDRKQVELDEDLWLGEQSRQGHAHFTTRSLGLLTNVIDGGLKTDLSLGFEMAEDDFRSAQWRSGDLTVRNPFHADTEEQFRIPAIYRSQRPLYAHLGPSNSGNFTETRLLGNFDTAKVQFEYPIYCAPTFDTLRSHYRTHHHVFETADGPAIFERPMDHVAGRPARRMTSGYFPTPSLAMKAQATQTSFKPVMDRTLFIVSASINGGQISYMYTPVVTMWNPFNVALEIEGAVSYLWLDLPFLVKWNFWDGDRRVGGGQIHTSHIGWQFDRNNPNTEGRNHGRSVDPYFYGAITATGAPLRKGAPNPTIRFEPGEVRLFIPSSPRRVEFIESAPIRNRTLFMKPFESPSDLNNLDGGLYITRGQVNARYSVSMEFWSNRGSNYPFFVSLEDATRAKGSRPDHDADRGNPIADVISRYFAQSGEGTTDRFTTPRLPYRSLSREPYHFAVLESYHRVAANAGSTGSQTSDLVYTSNPRQPWMTDTISNRRPQFESQKGSTGPQYQTRIKGLSGLFSNFLGGIDGRNTFYGPTNDASRGRTHLSFFEVPTTPMLSLAGFQHCDLSATTFSPANQFANSWAAAYVPAGEVATRGTASLPVMIDHCYLANEALWDRYYFSGAAPTVQPGSAPANKDETFWDQPVGREVRSLREVVESWVNDPVENPLRNSRLRLHLGNKDREELIEELLDPQGCALIAAHLLLDGSFNVNSTSVEAWKAVLASLRGADFELADGRPGGAGDETPQSRFQHPVGSPNDNWLGFRSLTDGEISLLAERLVEEVKGRGPFLSLAEFVNRRVGTDAYGKKGAIQAAIDGTTFNRNARQARLDTSLYDSRSRRNIDPADTGVGIPGFLTQADVLQSMAPVLTVRSDTFTIRTYGAARDRNGRLLAEAWVEAVVQRVPEFVDPADEAHTPLADLKPVNQVFGRRFRISSFRYLSPAEINS